jgi:dihydroxyacetone kinase
LVSPTLRESVLAAADALDAARNELGRLDGVAGDGDHGMTMSIGARNVRRKLQASPLDPAPVDLLRLVGAAMGDVGGAIGPLYAAAFAAMANEIEASAAGSPDVVDRLYRVAAAAESAMVDLGRAAPGDKTIIDALQPLVASLRDAAARGEVLDAAIDAAVEAAVSGAAATAGMAARIGRASRLGERSRGEPDAGATSFVVIVRAIVDAHRQIRARDR